MTSWQHWNIMFMHIFLKNFNLLFFISLCILTGFNSLHFTSIFWEWGKRAYSNREFILHWPGWMIMIGDQDTSLLLVALSLIIFCYFDVHMSSMSFYVTTLFIYIKVVLFFQLIDILLNHIWCGNCSGHSKILFLYGRLTEFNIMHFAWKADENGGVALAIKVMMVAVINILPKMTVSLVSFIDSVYWHGSASGKY